MLYLKINRNCQLELKAKPKCINAFFQTGVTLLVAKKKNPIVTHAAEHEEPLLGGVHHLSG